MLPAERHSRIVESVVHSDMLSTEQLAGLLGVSLETIRRDLAQLDDEGRLRRIRGGAARIAPSVEPAYQQRSTEQLEAKRAIARIAAELIPDNGLTFIDVGTTTLEIARAVRPGLRATVVTTSLPVAAELSTRPAVRVVVAGGEVRPGDQACSGPAAEAYLSTLNPDLALVGSGGIDTSHGLTDFHEAEAAYRRGIVARSARTYAVAVAAKLGSHAPYTVCPLTDLAGVITDGPVPQAMSAAARELGLDLRVSGET